MSKYSEVQQLFEPELLAALERHAAIKEVKEGTILIDFDNLVLNIPLVLKGSIRVSRLNDAGQELVLYYVNALESCAMTFTCCMQELPSEIRAVAEDDVTMIAIPIRFMEIWLSKYPTWKSFVMRTIRARFHELLTTIDYIAFEKLDERLVYYLTEKSKATGTKLINLSHEQIANEMATSRVVVSRLLKKLENDGKLLLYRNQIKLLKDL